MGLKGECIIPQVQQISIRYFQGSELSSRYGHWQLVYGRSRSEFTWILDISEGVL